MKTSESIKAIAPALLQAQKAIKSATKDATNPHFKSKYADLASVIDACKAALNSASITFLQPVSAAEHGVTVETMLLHTSGEWISESLTLPVSKNDAQGVGSAISYGKRYGLQAMVGIPSEDDDGNAATKPLPRAIPANVEGAELYEKLPVDAKTVVQDDIKEMAALVKSGDLQSALSILLERYDSHEDQLMLASQMPSEPRNKIKAYKRSIELASQP